MKKKFVRLISAVLSAAMTLTAVPLSAFAEGEAHTHDGESNVITTPLDFREKTADENGVGWSWDYDTKTLTLNGVNIQATTNSMSVVTVPDGTKIVLNGNNTIVQTDTGKSDTYVLSAVNNKEVNCDGTMTISGDGVLNAENRSTDSMARSLGGSIILNGGTVNATGTVKTNSLEIHNDGVLNANATTASFEGVAVNVSGGITVDGNGSLTAVGCANESTLNSAILLTSNFDKISVSENGSITVPEGNAARVGIYYSGNNGDGMDAEISGGKVTAYGAKYGIYKVNLIMSGTGSVYTTGGSYAIGQTVPTIDKDEFVVKGSTEFKAEESAVTGEVKLNGGYYEIDGADAKTVVIKPDTSPRIILGNQIGIFKTEEYKIIEDIDMTDIKLKGTVYFDITLKNMSDEEFADARGCFGGDEPDLSASIIKTDYGWVCMVCDTEFSTTYDTDNTLTIKCGDIVSNTVQVKSNANRFNKVTQGDNTNRTVFYTNTSQEEKDNYKLVSTYTVDSESISYNWYSTNSAYSADELGAAVSGSNGEFKLADNIPAGNYVLYCDITYSDGDSTETVTEKFTFTYKECAHENGYSDGKCTNCGALCDHSDIDINTGKCNKCGHQFVATISTDGSAPIGYGTLADCLNSVTADTENYVKIYQDIGDTSETAILDTIDVKHNVMIDLNGHKLNNIKLGVNKLGVNKDVTLTLTGTAGSYVTQVYVRKGGGSFIIDSEANVEFNTIFVEDSARLAVSDGAKVTTEQLTVIASVADDGTTTTSVKLATGMKLGGLTYHRQNNSGALKLGNLLDVTRQALRREDNGNYLDLYKEYGSMGYSVALTVVEHTDADHKYSDGTGKCEECGKPCEHGGDINTDTGICSVCGAVVSVALYTDGDGSLKYVDTDELDSLLNEYNGSGTIKLFKDYSKPSAQYDLYGELTIDLNGRQFKIRSITPCKSGKLTIKNSGNPVMLGCNVYPTNDASYAGGTLIIDGDVVLDTSIYVYDSSTVILKDGTYTAGLYARDSKTLYDMLGEGKAFFKTDGTLFNANVKEISSSETLTIKDHSHTYVDGECGCGYVCPHSDVDIDTGKCTECEYQYAAVIVKDGAAASVYKETEMEAAFEAADSDANTGCTLKVYKNYAGSYTTLSRKFTLWIAEEANVGTLTVSGDITVTGSEKNNSIYGDFDVEDGGKLTFDENCGAKGTVSVGAGTFDCYRSLGIILNINDASSDVILHDGAFLKIRYNGGGDRANAEILTLLAENRMFMTSSAVPIDGSKTLLKDGFVTPVIVAPHEDHSYDSTTGKCTICGKRCGHTDVDSKTGVCSTCKYQLTAGISGVGTAKYFDNIDNAFTAALSAENNGCTLTLYKDCELSQNIVIGNATLTVDVNGHSISPEIRGIDVNDGGVLYLKNSGENGSIGLEMAVNKGGTLINGTADDSSSAVSLFAVTADAAECVEFYGGSCTYLTIKNGTSGIALYGGYYDIICGSLTDNTPVNDLLAKGYAFATLNSVTHLPESIVDGSAKTIGDGLTNVMVVAHEHRYNVETGKCPCGVCALAIFTETTQSSETYTFIESETQFKNIAENEADGVLKLTGDVDCIVKGIIINGNKTIDMNGHTLNVSVGTEEISAVAVYGNVTFENSGSSRAVINATGVYSYGMVTVNGDIEFDTFATFEDGDALINAGVFKSIYVQGRSVIEILGSGKALASESGEILNASVQQIYKAGDNIFVKAHPKHTYDDHGNCACGYKCLHDGEGQVDEDSANKVCSECGAKIYAKVTTADGKVKYFDDITEGLRYADKAENKGCVFTLVTSGKINSGVTLSNGQFTITTSNYGTIYDYNQTITIDGADVIAEGYMFIRCKVNVKSGSLTLPEGSSAGFDSIAISGGTVTVSEGVNVDNTAGADNLFVSEDATDAKLTIGGGTYSNINLGQFKLKDVIASGVRVISYDNPTDPTAEKTAKALLYSDIAEKNNFDSENNTVSYYLFTKCEHKNEDGSYAFNDSGICKYCNSEFAASVSYTVDGSAKTELFGDIYDAFDKANEIGTATVTLYKDITDKCTQEITVMGNVTLELNGKTLGGRYGIARISVSDGGTLTVNGDGNMDTPIYVNENSKLVINGGGYFNSVSVKKGGNAEIGGGTIRGLSVRGNVKLSGGKFNDIEIFNGNLESVLADGYAYKVDGGEWLSIAERAESVYSSLNNNDKPLSVEEAPIKSASISWAGGEAPVIYRNGAKKLKVNVTCDVADTSKRITYSDFVNGNNRSKDSKLSVNWYMVFGYKIGEIVAEDGEVEYYTVLKCDGYEYKSNALKFTLATCSHPEDSFNNETDGLVFCGICDLLIEAEVVDADGKSLGYADIESAIKLAQENEGSTVKLISERVPASITVTGGKFTVDFNGKEAYCQFTVNGGDVTFTSSAVQDVSNQNLPSGITVNGTDAEVTIDGKIKLGRVRIISSTLTVNSTDGYIGELSIEGGNAVIDGANIDALSINGGATVINGANIDALKANGGDTVINDVNADSLTMCDNRSGGSEYNISIVSGRFGSFTCENGSNYTLGRAIASGSRVIGLNAIVGSGFKYAEIQSMTKANYLNVIKCDHKDENDSYVLDGNLCPYCNEEIAATVSYTTANGGEQTDLFSDIYDAFERANERGTATITLYKDIENSELTRGINVTGNVTLALNGKKLGYSFVSLIIEVSDGGMLTVDGDGNMQMPIIVNENAKLTVNGGEIATVMIYKDGDAVIGGGFIEDLVVNGNAKLSGGKFYNLEIANGSLESILADGYAYKKDGGSWLSIAERAKEKYYSWNNEDKPVSVEEAPIKSATLSTEINQLYRNSNANPTLKFNLTLAHGSNLNDSYVSKRYGINSYVSGDIIYSSLSALVKDAKLSADEIIDKAGDSDVAEIYFVVITDDGYEIKSNTVSIDLVDCDHSQVVDPTADKETAGNITEPTYCEICESKFNAKITKGDDVRYYNDLDEAAKDAQKSENEGCTLYPLYNKNGYGGQLVITEGNFTLKYAVRTAFSRPIIINGKAKLTVTGRCAVTAFENQDAFIVQGGDVTFDGLATGSNVTINGGNVTMASNNINCLTINGGNVSISSGGFAEIVTTVSDKVIADYIDPGFWVQDRGTKEWIDIYSLNKATASSTNGLTVRLCPMQIIKPIDTVYYTNGYYPDGIPSLQISAVPWYSGEVDAKVAYQWIAIDENGNETEIEGATDRKLSLENLTTGRYYCRLTYSNATTAGVSMASDVVTATITECEHSGGEATCTNKAKCEICGAEYGETKPHSYAQIKSPEYLKSAATCTAKAVYYTSCTECGRSSEGTADEATFEYGNALGHKYGEWVSNGDGTHTRVCANDSTHTETKACHGGKATCTAKAICEVCGKAYGEMKPHSYTNKKSPEYLKSAATCTAKAVYYTSCADCGLSSKGTADEATFEYGNALGHKYGEWVSNGDGTHSRVCANDSTHIETKNCHGGKATCTAKAICEVCGKAYGEMTAHTFTAKSAVSRYLKKAATCTEKSEYYVSCAGCGLSSKGTKSEATFEGSALGHLLTQWNVTDASCTESGSEERHCTRCDYKQTQIIPAKGHTFGEWKITKNVGCVTDGEQTRECTVCGSKETKVIAATGVHVYGGWKVTKAPTCTTAGVKERTCAGCNAKETMTLQATGHKYTTSTVKPTYSAKGYTLYKCSLCGKSYKCNYTNMLVLPSVSGLKATSRTDKSITLGWNRNANATGYVIEYYNGAKWVKKSTVTKNTTVKYTVSSLKPGTVNKFRIRAYKATNYSAYSYITVNTLPSAVSGFKTVSKTSSTSTLSWNKNTSADGYIIERYIVNRWIQTQKVVGSGNVSTTIKSLTAGSTNKLRIRAYKTINKKTEYSSYTYLNVKTKPARMTGLKAKSKTNNTVTLQWNKNATADSVFIEKYDGSKWVNVKKLSAGFTTYTVNGLSSGRTYRFRVRAYRAGEYSGYTYLNVNTRPYTTTGMKSKSVTKNSIVLQWNKNTSADGYSIEKYDGKKWVQVKRYTSNKSTTYTIKGLKARTTYKFRMRAYKTIGKVNEYSAYTYCNVTTAK